MSWRRLRTLLVREVRATLRDPFTLTVLILVPLAALLAFGFVLSTEVNDLDLGVHDASQSDASRRLVADLGANGTFRARPYATREALQRALVGGAVSVGLVIPPGFGRDLDAGGSRSPATVQVLYDGGEATLAGNAESFARALIAATGASLAPAPRHGSGVAITTSVLFNPRLDGTPFMVAGTFGFVLSFLTTLITAVSIVNERNAGTFEQLQVTPATSVEVLLGKLLPLGAMFALDVAIMMTVGWLVLDVWPRGSALFFWVASAVYVLVSLSLGLLVSASSSTANEAVQKTVLLSIPLVQLSGFAFPIRNMPSLVQWATELFPATHYIRVSHAVYLRGADLAAVWPDMLFIVVFGVVLFVLALRSLGART